MKLKKILLLFILFFVITGCTAQYELSYEDDVFKEHIVITEEMVQDSNTTFGITSLKKNKDLAKIDDNNYYKYSFSTDGKNNVLTLDFTYDNLSIDKSLVYNNCFRYRNFIEGDNYYYINLEGDMTCEYLSSVDITFKTDKLVYMENADEKDLEKGVYKWNNFTGGKIYIQVSKTETIESSEQAKSTELIPWYVKVIISILVIGVIVIICIKIKRDHR